MKKKKLIFVMIFLNLIENCKRGSEIQKIELTQSSSGVTAETHQIDQNGTDRIRSLADIFRAPVKEIPVPIFARGSRIETRVPNMTFQVPLQDELKYEFKELTGEPHFNNERRLHIFKYKNIIISYEIIFNITVNQLLKNVIFSDASAVSHSYEDIKGIFRFIKPRPGYFFERNIMRDQFFTLLMDYGTDVHRFVVCRSDGQLKNQASLSDDDLKNILFSLKLK